MLVLYFYLIDILDTLENIIICLAIFSLIAGILLFSLDKKHMDSKEAKNSKKFLVFSIVCFVLLILIPSKSTMEKMGAAYVVQEVTNNERVQTLANSSLDLIEKSIQNKLNEGKKR